MNLDAVLRLFRRKKTSRTIDQLIDLRLKSDPLYKEAFTLPSKRKKGSGNDRLEFLGDAVLGVVISEYLFKRYKNYNSGHLTEMRSKLTNRKFLNELAINWKLYRFFQHKTQKNEYSKDAYGNTLEALIAAVYLDQGLAFCSIFILDLIKKYHSISDMENVPVSYKHELLQKCIRHKISHHIERNFVTNQYEIILSLGEEKVTYKELANSVKEAEEKVCKTAYNTFEFSKK